MVRLNSVDRLGRAIDPETLAAAQAIAGRAIQHAVGLIGCPALATSLLEEAAATVSRAVRRKAQLGRPPVLNLQAYLFRSFLRRVNGVRQKEALAARVVAVAEAGSSNGAGSWHAMESKILVDEFLRRCDPAIRDMFYRRVQGMSWNEIGRAYGITAHAAESRFSQQLNRVRKRLGLG
jgi:DNA-directed RNA polymerase specialized sigma24 family protein